MSIPQAALEWIVGDDTGMSSEAIWAHMVGAPKRHASHPYDPDDLGRCVRLLDKVPEWRARIGEMAPYSPEWAALVGDWPRLETTFALEMRNGRAPLTYARMQELLYPGDSHG
jgi:hypothetical protein